MLSMARQNECLKKFDSLRSSGFKVIATNRNFKKCDCFLILQFLLGAVTAITRRQKKKPSHATVHLRALVP
jgi:hypothetical protein